MTKGAGSLSMEQYEAALMKMQRRGNERRLVDIGFGASLIPNAPVLRLVQSSLENGRDPAPGDQPVDDSDLDDQQPISEESNSVIIEEGLG